MGKINPSWRRWIQLRWIYLHTIIESNMQDKKWRTDKSWWRVQDLQIQHHCMSENLQVDECYILWQFKIETLWSHSILIWKLSWYGEKFLRKLSLRMWVNMCMHGHRVCVCMREREREREHSRIQAMQM